jgi:Alginate export
MQKSISLKLNTLKALELAAVAYFSLSAITPAQAAEPLNADPAKTALPPPSYTRAPMAAYNFMMDDPLLGNSYEKPVWNLHDALNLPEWLSVGVEQRTRYESLDNAFKGSQKTTPSKLGQSKGGDQQIALQTDLWIQAKFNKFRFALEFLDARTSGSDAGTNNTPFPANNSSVDTLDFAQGYVSWADQNAFKSGYGAEIKFGRQTMDLGSRRLVARPIFRNTVNNFTGLRTRVVDYDKWQFNAFMTMPVLKYPNYNSVTPNADMLNNQQWDKEDLHTWFSGGIFEYSNLYQNLNAEVALYQLSEGDSTLNPTRNRNYFTPTIRFYQKPSKGNFDFQAEGMGQFGTVKYAATGAYANTTQQHEAWSSHIEAGYSFDLPWSPRFYLEYDYATGSSNWKNHAASATDSRFDPLYGASDFDFGPTGIYGAFQRSNINSPGYKLDFAPRPNVSFRLQQRLVWLASAGDCWGTSTCTSATQPSLANGNGSFVGDQIGVTGRYNFNSSINFDAGWYHLFKGEFAKSAQTTTSTGGNLTGVTPAPGADTDYFFVQSQLRF